MNLKRLIVFFSCLLLCVNVTLSWAQKKHNEYERSWDLGLGIGYGSLDNPFVGSDDVPLYLTVDFSWYGKRFFFDNGDLGFTLVDRKNLGVNLIMSYDSERFYYSFLNDLGIRFSRGVPSTVGTVDVELVRLNRGGLDNPNSSETVVAYELPERDYALNMGVELLVGSVFGEMQLQLTQDIIGAHSGNEARIEYWYPLQTGRWLIKPTAGIVWKDKDLVDYYYGINPSDGMPNELIYSPKAATNNFFGLSMNYRINSRWSILSSFRRENLSDQIINSPLVEKDHSNTIFTGVFYQF